MSAEADSAGDDPANRSHPAWAATQLAEMLMREDGFDETAVACAFLAVAQSLARRGGIAMPFAVMMEGAAVSLTLTADMRMN